MRTYTKFAVIVVLNLLIGISNTLAADGQHEMFAPVPKAAMGPVIDSNVGYAVEELGRGLFVVHDGAPA